MLEIKNLSFSYHKPIFNQASLSVGNEIVALLGVSGSGKSTLLQIIAGLLHPESGEIIFNGKNLLSLPCEKREIGLVFQDYALFPHLNVEKNVLFGIKKRVQLDYFLSLLEISHLRYQYPHEISGGEAQRVAIARSLAAQPKVLLLDEPFSNLDEQLKLRLQKHLLQIQKQCALPILFVTHDKEDALRFAHRIIVLENGKLLEK